MPLISSSRSCYAVAISWLENSEYIGPEAEPISKDLFLHLNMGHGSTNHSFTIKMFLMRKCAEFPTTTFLDHLGDLIFFRIESHHATDAKMQFCLPKTELTTTVQRLQQSLDMHALALAQTYTLRGRRSPKRRFASEETTTSTMYASFRAINMSTAQYRTLDRSSLSKRRRLSVSADTSVRDERSPTPPVAPADIRSPSPTESSTSTMPLEVITVSMLRALTKDIRRKYRSPY